MNTSALKAFAPAVRKQLIEAVSRKLDFALSARTPDYLDTYASQVRSLRELAATDRKGLIERVAYTWFNRFAALRYLDARNWHPFHARVLMAKGAEDTIPEIFTMARAGAIPEGLRRYVNVARIDSLLQGRIPSADLQGEVYRILILAACRFYHGILPDVFERLDDETELLLPDDLLTEQSVAQGFRTEITDEDCQQVEVLGWLYQFYISEKKDQVMARKAVVPSEDIPAVTQLFTPHWIVRYLVENSVGRLWLLNRPESLLKAKMQYYIDSTEPETEFVRIERPQDIRICDPAAGSGHMLTYAFDLLCVVYEEEGYASSEIPALILQHNLTGIEIDCRAAQLAALALTLKAREKSPRFFTSQQFVRPNIVELRNVHFGEGELRNYSEALRLGGLFTPSVLQLMHQFEEAKTVGSLIEPCIGETEIAFALGSVEVRDLGSNLFLNSTHQKVLRVLWQAAALSRRYHVVLANPPYMGAKAYNSSLKQFIEERYADGKGDLYACFILRNLALCLQRGAIAMITIPNWMSLSSFTRLRQQLTRNTCILSLVHNGRGIWGSDFGSCSFIVGNERLAQHRGSFRRLFDRPGSVASCDDLEQRFFAAKTQYASMEDFALLPGQVFAYWISPQEKNAFHRNRPLSDVAQPRQGLATADDNRFLRLWYEPAFGRLGIGFTSIEAAAESRKKWFPFSKGGSFRRWYGNNDFVVNWEANGEAIKAFRPRSVVRNEEVYFRSGVTWSLISIASPSFRFLDDGFVIGHKGPALYSQSLLSVLAYSNSRVATNFLSILSPALGFEIGQIRDLPFIEIGTSAVGFTKELIAIHRADWDSFETSWDFSQPPLLSSPLRGETLEESWQNWQAHATSEIRRAQKLEADNNQLFIEAYNLQDVLTPEVSEENITLAHADASRDMAAFLSYAVGCMMGRYSLDRLGLILANTGDGLKEYLAKVGRSLEELRFTPNEYGIVPILDNEWFADDIVARTREFLKATFGEAKLRENIRFIEEALGRELRAYFLTDFYKDHLQTYKKRPIYWMVQSPRKGFSVLIYLHRYTRDTMNLILNRYLREFQVKLRSKIDHLQQIATSISSGAREKTVVAKELAKLMKVLHECEEWERQTILPLAQARIELDLDDGVKVNYLKLGEALGAVPGLAAAEE